MEGVKGDGGSILQAEISKFSFEIIDVIPKEVDFFHDGRIANGVRGGFNRLGKIVAAFSIL